VADGGYQQVTVGIGKPVKQHEGLLAPVEQQLFFAGTAGAFRFKKTAGWFCDLALYVFNAPWCPKGFHNWSGRL
jgi:hypothetical protein